MSHEPAPSADTAERRLVEALVELLSGRQGLSDAKKWDTLAQLIADHLRPGEVMPSPDRLRLTQQVLNDVIARARRDALDKLPGLRAGCGSLTELASSIAERAPTGVADHGDRGVGLPAGVRPADIRHAVVDRSESSFRVAAAGELLGLGHEGSFRQLLAILGGWVNYENLRGKDHHRGAARQRQLRAALWTARTSAKSAREDETLLQALATAIARYLPDEPHDDEGPYIPRPDYEEPIRQQRQARVNRIWLYGDAGTGKSRLARAANADVAVEVIPARAENLNDDLSDLIVKCGIPARDINPANITVTLLDALNTAKCPPVVVFDDMPNNKLLERLMKHSTRATLIFTSTDKPPGKFTGLPLYIEEMDQMQASQMIRSRLPKATDDEVARLFEVMGGRPLALEDSCAFINVSRMSVTEFCAAVTEGPAEALEEAGQRRELHQRTLTETYRMTLGALEAHRSGPSTLKALDFILFNRADSLTPTNLSHVWDDEPNSVIEHELIAETSTGDGQDASAIIAREWPGAVQARLASGWEDLAPLSKVKLEGALGRLVQHSLIRKRSDDRIIMHQFTRTILRDLRSAHAEAVWEHLTKVVYQLAMSEKWRGGQALSMPLLAWTGRLHEPLDLIGTKRKAAESRPLDEQVQLATLAAMRLRGLRQLGERPVEFHRKTVVPIYRAVLGTLQRSKPRVPQELVRARDDLEREIIDWLVFNKLFDPAFTGDISQTGGPTRQLTVYTEDCRLKHATEWELAQHYADVEERERAATPKRLTRADLGVRPRKWVDYQSWADNAVLMATVYYDQARWNDAIGALEHAFSCYQKVGANTDCIHGALDAARRLSGVNLRAGNLNDAAMWLMRAAQFNQVRNLAPDGGLPSPYKLYDVILGAQLGQAQMQLEITNAVLAACEDPTSGELAELARQHVADADGLLGGFMKMIANRQIPEAAMDRFRLALLTRDQTAFDTVGAVRKWFRENQLVYQQDLLSMQTQVILTPFLFATLDRSEANRADEVAQIARALGPALAQTYGEEQPAAEAVYHSAQVVRDHANPYWYARGLCAAFMLGLATDHGRGWLGNVEHELEVAATAINRPDWIERIQSADERNRGLWLLGY